MFLRSQPQWGRFSRPLPTDLRSGFLTDRAVQLVRAPLARQLLFERKCTPGTARFDLLRPPSQQQQVRHPRDGHRALRPGGILGHLVLPQAHDTIEFLDTEFDRPSAQIEGHGQVRSRVWQIDHEQFGVFGAVVTPPATEPHGDISHVRHLCLLGKGPEGPATGSRDDRGDTDLAIRMNRQMGDQIP
jgi:hypothetical protein